MFSGSALRLQLTLAQALWPWSVRPDHLAKPALCRAPRLRLCSVYSKPGDLFSISLGKNGHLPGLAGRSAFNRPLEENHPPLFDCENVLHLCQFSIAERPFSLKPSGNRAVMVQKLCNEFQVQFHQNTLTENCDLSSRLNLWWQSRPQMLDEGPSQLARALDTRTCPIVLMLRLEE